MSDRITMLNRALLRIGADPLVTELDPGAPVHLAVYDSVLERFAAKPWSFFKVTRRLTRLAAAPEHGWRYAYELPADRMAPPRAVYYDTSRTATVDFDIIGAQLLTDYEQIWIVYLRTAGYELWPGDFREAFTTALMAELALSVREDRPLHDRLYAKAFGTPQQMGTGGLFGAALDNDSQGLPSEDLGGGESPLIDVRW